MKRLLERIKLWWKGTPVRVRPERTYSISGWVREADGTYRNGESKIYREGRSWYREDPGCPSEKYPTLHAAIKRERTDPDEPAALFQEMSRRSAEPLIGASGSEDGRDA